MQINVTFDSSVASAPVGSQAAVQAAVQYFEQTFSTPITVNITFGWGEVGGQAMDPDSLGESLTTYVDPGFAISAKSLVSNVWSPAISNAILNLPSDGPSEPIIVLPNAEAKALNLPSDPSGQDGY